jgi:hypothetical protein
MIPPRLHHDHITPSAFISLPYFLSDYQAATEAARSLLFSTLLLLALQILLAIASFHAASFRHFRASPRFASYASHAAVGWLSFSLRQPASYAIDDHHAAD